MAPRFAEHDLGNGDIVNTKHDAKSALGHVAFAVARAGFLRVEVMNAA
jgi:hypothetical protein